MSETRVVEINGTKVEVDQRTGSVTEAKLRVGSRVKLLEKNTYSGMTVHPGVIVGFENFPSLPTIIVAYVKTGYSETDGVQFAYINKEKSSADKWEMVASDDDALPIKRAEVLNFFDRAINKEQTTLDDLKARRDFFLRNFSAYFTEQMREAELTGSEQA